VLGRNNAAMPNPNASELKELPLFASLSGSDRTLLAANLEVRAVAAGTTLIAEGQDNDAFFVLSWSRRS
jgi:hypothetical protein